MAGPHVAIARRRTITSADDRGPPASLPNALPFVPSSPTGPPLISVPEHHQGYTSARAPPSARFSARLSMPFELSAWHAQWLSRLRSALRLLVIVLSGAVIVFLVHTLEIYRGNRYLDLRKGELPMTWPARTNLAPTLILFAVAVASFLASLTAVGLTLKRSFRRPIRPRGVYRVLSGSFGVLLWAAAIAAFTLLDKASKASLGRYSCGNKNVLSNGRYQYRAVCEEQGVAFYLAIGAAAAELTTLLTLTLSSPSSPEQRPPGPKDDHEKKRSMSISSGTKRYP